MITTYTVRMGFIDISLWNQTSLVEFYKTELSKAGFTTSQFPSVLWPSVTTKLVNNASFQGSRSISINVPYLGDFEQTRDTRLPYSQDKAALAEAGKAVASIFTWNLCAPDSLKDAAGTLRDIFRRLKPEGSLKLSPKVSLYKDAPIHVDGYPDLPLDPCGAGLVAKKSMNQGLWSLLIGIGLSVLSKGKV